MKSTAILAIFALALAFSSAQALTTDDMLQAVVAQQDSAASLASFVAVQNKESKAAYVLVKYIVVPSKAKSFIEVVEEVKHNAASSKGYKAYDLVKTLDDNISYYAWASWESPEDLVHFIKSDAAKKLIEYTEKEDIVALISAVKPLV